MPADLDISKGKAKLDSKQIIGGQWYSFVFITCNEREKVNKRVYKCPTINHFFPLAKRKANGNDKSLFWNIRC